MRVQSPSHTTEMSIYDEDIIAVCKFTKSFVPEEGDVEVTMDGN